MALPFGTHDEKGFVRKIPLSDELKKSKYKNLLVAASAVSSQPLQQLIAANKFKPIIKQIKSDTRWVTRIRLYNGKPVLHFSAAVGVAPSIRKPTHTPVNAAPWSPTNGIL